MSNTSGILPSLEQAYEKIKYYCAYQERCHAEVKNKLYELGLNTTQVDILLCQLIEDNFLNEERFATKFVSGKLRIKKWGIHKIKAALNTKGISEYIIKKALSTLDYNIYLSNLQYLFEKKLEELKTNKLTYKQQFKIQQYLISKGYALADIQDCFKQHFSS